MTIANSIPWIDSNLYNKFPDVYSARNAVSEEAQIAIAKAIVTSIPELKNHIGIGIAHNHWTLNLNEHIIGHLKDHNLYSKPEIQSTEICPTVLGATRDGIVITEAIDNPSINIFNAAKKIHEFATDILSHLPIDKGEEFSKFVVMITPQIIHDIDADCFLETNSNRTSVITPTTQANMQSSDEDTILTSVTVNPDEKGMRQVRCVSLCLGREPNYISAHAWEDPVPGGRNTIS